MNSTKRMVLAAGAAVCVSLGHLPVSFARAEAPQDAPAGDVIARVGDQTITFGEINTALNSSAIVGLSVPALGTPERDTVRITLLDRFISANLLYLDARKQGLDKDPLYQRKVQRFDNAVLAGLYQSRLAQDVTVSEDEIRAYHDKNMVAGTELSPELRASIESKLRRDKLRQQLADARSRLRDGVQVTVHEENLAAAGDADRGDGVALAEIDAEPITWGSIKDKIIAAGTGAVVADPLAIEQDARRQALDAEIDLRIMAAKARAAGLDDDPLYRMRSGEYRKTLLTNWHRDQLIKEVEPSDKELQAFYEANRSELVIPEARKVQMVVLKTRDEAARIKADIEAGELTLYQAARDHSIAAKAKEDLGEVGWVYQGDTAPALDKAIFALGPGETSDPVETPAGWHLVAIQDLREAQHTEFGDQATRKLVRRKYLQDRLDAYTAGLRKNDFPVEVYQDRLIALAQQEADMVKALAEKAQQPGSVTQKRIEELQKLAKPPL